MSAKVLSEEEMAYLSEHANIEPVGASHEELRRQLYETQQWLAERVLDVGRLSGEVETLKARLQDAEDNYCGARADTKELERQLAEVTRERDNWKQDHDELLEQRNSQNKVLALDHDAKCTALVGDDKCSCGGLRAKLAIAREGLRACDHSGPCTDWASFENSAFCKRCDALERSKP